MQAPSNCLNIARQVEKILIEREFKIVRPHGIGGFGFQFGKFLAPVHFNHTDVVAVILRDGITLTTLQNIAGLQPQSGPNGMLLMDRPQDISEADWVEATTKEYTRTPHLNLRTPTDGTHLTTLRSKIPSHEFSAKTSSAKTSSASQQTPKRKAITSNTDSALKRAPTTVGSTRSYEANCHFDR